MYPFGQVYRPAGNTPDPTGGDLQFFYAKRPTDPADLDTALDALWTEQFNELLILEVALYLAAKDGRTDELASLGADRTSWLRLFQGFLEHETVDLLSRFGGAHRIQTEALIPLLAPGA